MEYLYHQFLVALEENDNDILEIAFMQGIEGVLKEFEEYLDAFGYLKATEPTEPETV